MAMNTRKTRSVRVYGACDYCIGTEVLAKQEGRLCPGPCHRDGTKTLFYAVHNRWPISQLLAGRCTKRGEHTTAGLANEFLTKPR